MLRTAERTCVHGTQHACDEFVNTVTFLHEWHEGGDPAFVVGAASEMGEYQLLKCVDLILQGHQVGDCLITTKGKSGAWNSSRM